MYASVFFLTGFVAADLAGAFQILINGPSINVHHKLFALLIICESVLAMVAGGVFATYGNAQSAVDAFLGCVGVVFIHDLDEVSIMSLTSYFFDRYCASLLRKLWRHIRSSKRTEY